MGKRKFKRLENGFGSVVYLGEGRRKPYAARLSAAGNSTGQNTPKAIGYYETWQQAFEALQEYHRLNGGGTDALITFTDLYKTLVDRKQKRPQGFSRSLQKSFALAYSHSAAFYDKPFASIRAADYQRELDAMCGSYGTPTLKAVKNLWSQMGKLGEELDIAPKNYAAFCAVNQKDTVEHSEIFTEEEVSMLWEHSGNRTVAMLLVMIYSGFRVSEYDVITTDLGKMTFSGGLKTQAGKTRVVPIHSRIQPLVAQLITTGGYIPQGYESFRRDVRSTLTACGVEPKKHTPHDCRATFASRLYAAGVPDLHIKRMMGHSAGDLTKDVYTEILVDALRKSLEKVL